MSPFPLEDGSTEPPCQKAAEETPRPERKEALLPRTGLCRQQQPRKQKTVLLFQQGRVLETLDDRPQAVQAPLCAKRGGSLQNMQLNRASGRRLLGTTHQSLVWGLARSTADWHWFIDWFGASNNVMDQLPMTNLRPCDPGAQSPPTSLPYS